MTGLKANPHELVGAPSNPEFVNTPDHALMFGLPMLMAALPMSMGVLSLVRLHFADSLPGWTMPLMQRLGRVDGPRALILIGFGLFACCLLIVLQWRVRSRILPLAITDRGIYAYRGGVPCRFLPWESVTAIVRERQVRQRPGTTLERLRIQGPGFALMMNSQFSAYDEACRRLSQYARLRRIRLLDRTIGGGAGSDIEIAAL